MASAQTIAAGASHTVVLEPDGTVATFGLNNNGQLGEGSQETRKTPVDVTGLSDVIGTANALPTGDAAARSSDELVSFSAKNAPRQIRGRLKR